MIKKVEQKVLTAEFIENFNKLFDRNYSFNSISEYVNDPSCFFYIDYEKNEMAGFFYGYFLRTLSKYSTKAHLWTIQILPKYQRMGIGTAMIEKVKEIAREKNCSAIFLITQDDSDTALEFYAKIGGRQINDGLDRVVWITVE